MGIYTGGTLSMSTAEMTLEQITRLTEMEKTEMVQLQWFDLLVSILFAAFVGSREDFAAFARELTEHATTTYAQKYVDAVQSALRKHFPGFDLPQ
jgi:hypothetical protein